MVLVSPGDLMVVPPRAIHTFENASGTEEAELYMTSTPGHYIDCEYPARDRQHCNLSKGLNERRFPHAGPGDGKR